MGKFLGKIRAIKLVVFITGSLLWNRRRGRYKFLKEQKNRQVFKHIHALEVITQTMLHKQILAAIVEIARQQGTQPVKNLTIHPIPTTDYPVPAKRPLYSCLSMDRLEQRFGLKMPSWDSALRLCMGDTL